MKKKFLLLIFGIAAIGAHAQSIGPSTLNASGGTSTTGGNTYEWSVGEMTLINTASSGNLVVTQGVLQPVIQSTGIKETGTILSANLKVYPVPTKDILYLQPDFKKSGSLEYSLHDASGKRIAQYANNLITGNEKQSISLESLSAGNYTLYVSFTSTQEKQQSVFKVQKLH